MRKNAFFSFVLFGALYVSSLAAFNPTIATKGIAEGLAVHSIIQDNSGMMWLATEAGLYSFDGYHLRHFNNRQIGLVSFMEINADTLLIGGTKGLHAFLLNEKAFIDKISFVEEKVRAKCDDWIGTDKALYYNDAKFGSLSDIYSIKKIDNDIFVGTLNSLYLIRNGKVDLILDGCLLVGQIVDVGTEIAVGTARSLFFIDKNTLKVVHQTDLPVAKAVLERDSSLLIGTDEGLLVFDRNSNNQGYDFKRFNHNTALPLLSLAGDVVWSLFADKDNNVWIATDNGVSVIYNRPAVDWIFISEMTDCTRGNNIDCLLEDSKGRLWLGGTNGIIRIDNFKSFDRNSSWYRMGDPCNHIIHNRIRDIFEDRLARIWICSDGGLFFYDEATRKWNNVKVRDENPSWTYAISQDSIGNLLVEMSDSIYCLDQTSFKILSRNLNAHNSNNKLVYHDASGRKWISSQQGDFIYTGGIDKVGISTRQRLNEYSGCRPVYVTSVSVNGNGYVDDNRVLKRKIDLNYDENSLTVTFSDFSYCSENLNQYFYLIDGLKNDWLPVAIGENEISISYLPYGSYNLYISASKDKTSSPQLSIRISPPWYLSLPMMLLYFCLFLLLIVAIIIFFVQRKIIRLEKKEKAVAIETAKHKENILQQELVVTAKNKNATADTVASDDSFLRKITKTIEENMENPDFSPARLSEIMDVNQKQIYRKIKFLTGMTTVEYIRNIRLDHAAWLLRSGNFTIAEVMYRVGFSNASYFSRTFLAQHGLSPTEYKKNHNLC